MWTVKMGKSEVRKEKKVEEKYRNGLSKEEKQILFKKWGLVHDTNYHSKRPFLNAEVTYILYHNTN